MRTLSVWLKNMSQIIYPQVFRNHLHLLKLDKKRKVLNDKLAVTPT